MEKQRHNLTTHRTRRITAVSVRRYAYKISSARGQTNTVCLTVCKNDTRAHHGRQVLYLVGLFQPIPQYTRAPYENQAVIAVFY